MSDPLAPVTPAPAGRAERILVWYVRLLAIVFLTIGVLHWQPILGTPSFPGIATLTIYQKILTGALAVGCLVAAVGLWFAASWGTVVWLMVALTEIVAHVAFRDLFGANWNLVGFHLGAMFLYVLIAWRVADRGEA